MYDRKNFIKKHFGPLKSKLLKDFINEIIFENRNPNTSDVHVLQKYLSKDQPNPIITLKENEVLFRCRKVSPVFKINNKYPFFGLSPKESFVPPIERTKDLRANYKYIPYLYCSNNPYVAIAELRPNFNTKVNIAEITVIKSLRILDLTNHENKTRNLTAKDNFFNDLSLLFSLPVEDNDETIEYIPTQFIAEYVKKQGYDGIAYRSSVTPEINKDNLPRYNYVIFNYQTCKVIKTNIFKITGTYYDSENISLNDLSPIIVLSRIEEELATL